MQPPHTILHHSVRIFFAVIGICVSVLTARAERESNNIFLFDCTQSMQTAGLWEPAQQALDATVTSRCADANACFSIVPFNNEPYATIAFAPQGYAGKKETIAKEFGKYVKIKGHHTHISDALLGAFDLCDPNKDNNIYLLTDGQPDGKDTPARVAKTIRDWCDNHRNARLFYVALRKGVVPDEVAGAIELCGDAYVVECADGVIPEIADISSNIHANIEELDNTYNVRFSNPGEYPVKATCDDPIFNIEVVGGKASGGKIALRIVSREGSTVEELHSQLASLKENGKPYVFRARIEAADPKFFIANPDIAVAVADHLQSRLDFGQQAEFKAETSAYHPSFLWSEASEPGEFTVDLQPAFANVTDPSTALSLGVFPAEGEARDFRAWFNGAEVAADGTFEVRPGQPAVLRVQFDPDARDGKRYFTLSNRGSRGLDLIGQQPAGDFQGLTVRTKYPRHWNPLALTLFIIGLVLLGALVLWFLFIRRMVYPAIKVAKIEFAGPNGYYSSKKIKGARKVILTSRRRSQNIFSRLFTGEVRFVRAEHFSPEAEIVPAGGKKRIRLRNIPAKGVTDAWDFAPSALFAPYEKGDMRLRSKPSVKTEVEAL